MSNNEEEEKPKKLGIVEHLHSVQGKPSNNDENEKTLEEELTATKEKLAEREEQLGAIAMKAFEEEKSALVEAVKKDLGEDKGNEISEKITNPNQLEDVKAWLGVFVKERKDNDKKDDSGSVDLSKTGGQVPLNPSKSGYERGRDVVNALYDAYEEELFKQETGKKDFDPKRLNVLERKIEKLWASMKTGFDKRGKKLLPSGTHPKMVTCPKCGEQVLNARTCPNCGKEIMSKAEWHATIKR